MAITLLAVNDVKNVPIFKYIVDTEDEKNNIPIEHMVQGTEVQVIEGGKRYRLDCNLQWVEIKPYNGGGGSGGPTVEVESIFISKNGTVNAPYGKAYTPIYVDVENTYAAADEGKVVSNGALVAQAAHSTITQNGTYDTTLNDSVEIDVLPTLIVEVPNKDVNFIDYDGTILYSYTKEEFANLSKLPENPTHIGLTAQGWNWTKEQIDTQLIATPEQTIWVGQMYITSDGKTRIKIKLNNSDLLTPYLKFVVNGTVEVNWGDNSTIDTVTGNSLSTPNYISHTYATTGEYEISLDCIGGSFTFYESYLLSHTNSTSRASMRYNSSITEIYLGSNIVQIGNGVFSSCYLLKNITIPNSIEFIETNIFSSCYSLKSITIPNSAIRVAESMFYNCKSLQNIAIPGNLKYLRKGAFFSCGLLKSITIPNSIINNDLSGLSDTFYACYSLQNITIPSNITTIGGHQTFYTCSALYKIVFKSTIPPTITNSGIWYDLPTDCIIYVPSGRRTTYMSTTNYPNPNTYTYVEEA